MRLLLALSAMPVLAAALLLGCASSEEEEDDGRFHTGRSSDAYVIIGVAEAPDSTDPSFALLWRRVLAEGFAEFDDSTRFEAGTNDSRATQVRGIPGEFTYVRVEPGVYALDGVFAVVAENRVNYFANGVIEGPQRPGFEVGPGEAVYLGIWEVRFDGNVASARLWRLEEADMRAATRGSRDVVGEVRMRQVDTRAVPCNAHRMNIMTQRQIC